MGKRSIREKSQKVGPVLLSLPSLPVFRETVVSGPLGVEDISPSMSPDDKSFTRIMPRVPDSTKRTDASSSTLRRSDSPEIPFQAATGSSDGLDSSSSGNSFVGLRVVAKWSSNGYFYSGKITRDVGAGKYKLLFDDGYECDVLGKDILLCDPIPLDTEVTALSEDEYFSAGNETSRSLQMDCACWSLLSAVTRTVSSSPASLLIWISQVRDSTPITLLTLAIDCLVSSLVFSKLILE
jgi:hypothetical protein